MWKSCGITPLFLIFYNIFIAISLGLIVCLVLIAIMLSAAFLRSSSPLQSSYYRLVLVGCVVNSIVAIIYKTSATLTTILPSLTDASDSYAISLMVVGFCAWVTPFALSTSNFLFVLNRTTSLLCPTRHANIWTPLTTSILVVASVAFPFIVDWNTLFHPCRRRLFTESCSEFLLTETLYAAVIAFTFSVISLTLAITTLILTQKNASIVILRAEKHFLFQAIVASACLTGFSVFLWLSAHFMTINQPTWSCILSFVYESCYNVYIISNYISHFVISGVFRHEFVTFYRLNRMPRPKWNMRVFPLTRKRAYNSTT